MIKSILVGVCGTRYSQAAAEQALQLAKSMHASLVAMAVIDLARVCPVESVPLGASGFKTDRDAALRMAAHEKADKLLTDLQRRAIDAGIEVQTQKVESEPDGALCTEAQRVDLLVVGMKHHREEQGDASPATLQGVLRHASRPVLCVPAPAADHSPALIAFDGSNPSARAVQQFVVSGLAAGREVHLLSVGDRAATIAERCEQYLASHGIAPVLHLSQELYPGDQILDLSQRIGAGVIVMGAYGHSWVRETFFGSVTNTVVLRAKVPVFLYH
jgi:nucleotide-binding universal stress UspA family protein